jgi:hypothetical protein
MTIRELERRAALLQMMEASKSLPGSGYRYVLARDPKRSADQIRKELGTAYVEQIRQDYVDISEVVSVRRQRRLRSVG